MLLPIYMITYAPSQSNYLLLKARWRFFLLPPLVFSYLLNFCSLFLFKYPFTTFLAETNTLGMLFIWPFSWFILLLKNYNTSDTCWKVSSFDTPLNDITPMHPLSSPFKNINTFPIFRFMSNDMLSNLQRWKNV